MLADNRFQKPSKSIRRRTEDLFRVQETTKDEEFFFDIESELTQDRVAKMFESLEQSHESGDWLSFCKTACALRTLFPDRPIRPDLFTEETFQQLVSHIEELITLFPYLDQLRVVYLFYPQKHAFLNQKFPQDRLEASVEHNKQQALAFDNSGMIFDFYYEALYLSLLNPQQRERFATDEILYQKALGALQEEQKEALQREDVEQKKFNRNFCVSHWRELIFFYPNRKQEILSPPDVVRQFCKETLDEYATAGEWDSFARAAENIALLSARRIDVPAPGRFLVTPSSKSFDARRKLPEMKEY